MSFESWEAERFDAYYGHDQYEPDEDCPCECGGNPDDCTYDPDEDYEVGLAEYKMDQMEDEAWQQPDNWYD